MLADVCGKQSCRLQSWNPWLGCRGGGIKLSRAVQAGMVKRLAWQANQIPDYFALPNIPVLQNYINIEMW